VTHNRSEHKRPRCLLASRESNAVPAAFVPLRCNLGLTPTRRPIVRRGSAVVSVAGARYFQYQ